ncbi:hypothetical protein Bca4012_037007 [Brassica carinata]
MVVPDTKPLKESKHEPAITQEISRVNQVLKNNLEMLYKDYHARKWVSSSCVSATTTLFEIVNEFPLEEDFDNDLFELERSIAPGVGNSRTNLDIYLAKPRVNRKAFSDLIVLVHDLLSIPITT